MRLAKIDAQAKSCAQRNGGETLGILIDAAAVSCGLDIRDNCYPLGDIQGECDTCTAAQGAVVYPCPANVEVGDNVAMGADEHITVEILISLIAEVREFVGNGKALETCAETSPVTEPVAEVDVIGNTGAIVRSLAVCIALAVKAEIHSQSGSNEPTAVVFGFFLGACRY